MESRLFHRVFREGLTNKWPERSRGAAKQISDGKYLIRV